MSKEIWKPVPGYEGLYEVSSRARVRSVVGSGKSRRRGRVLKGNLHKGYRQVKLWRSGKKYNHNVARIVAGAFVGPRPRDYDCCHNDGNRLNDLPENLRWDTRAGNLADKRKHLTGCGEKHYKAKLTDQIVRIIRGSSERICVLSKRYRVNHVTLRNAKLGITWRHVK